MSFHTMTARNALTALWSLGGLPTEALDKITLTGHDPVFPSSFAIGATAALAACERGIHSNSPAGWPNWTMCT